MATKTENIAEQFATAAKIRDYWGDYIFNVKVYDAYGDGTSDDTVAIQKAIEEANTGGGGVVYFPEGTYIISSPLSLPSKVYLEGVGMDVTTIKASSNFTGTALIKTENFDSLTGQNKWFVSEGVAYGFGINKLTIDGNSLTVKGVQIYGKRFFVDELGINNCWDGGWYSEAGYKGGQSSDDDMPEAIIDKVYIYNCKGYGFDYLGPHDGYVKSVYISGNNNTDTKGARFLKSIDVYHGVAEIGHMHIYGLEREGFYCETNVKADLIISENVDIAPLVIGGSAVQISKIENYGGVNAGETAVKITASQSIINNINVRLKNGVGNGMEINANECIINAQIYGENSVGAGLRVNGRGNIIHANITDFDGVGGVGFDFNSLQGSLENNVSLNIRHCETAIKTDSTNSYINRVHVAGYGHTNVISGNFATRDFVTGALSDTGAVTHFFQNQIISTGTVDLTTTAVQDIVIPHRLAYTPNVAKTTVMLYSISSSTIEVAFIRVKSVDATNVTVSVKLATAGTGTGNLLVQVSV